MKFSQDKILTTEIKVNWITSLKWLFSMTFFSFIIVENKSFFKEIFFVEAFQHIRQIPNSSLISYMLLGFLAVSVTSLYDFLWFYFNPRGIRKKEIFKISFIANSVNNIVGMGGLGASIIRMIFYRNVKVTDSDLIKINILLIPSFFTGLGLLMCLSFFKFKTLVEILSNYPVIYWLLPVFIVYLMLYLLTEFIPLSVFKEKLENLGFIGSLKLKLSMVTVSAIDWFAAVMFLWIIGVQINPQLNFQETVFFFIVASALGIMSPIPSGFCVFDTVMIIGLQNSGLSGTESFIVLLIYRIFYYVFPFICAISMTIYELIVKGNGFVKTNEILPIFLSLEKKVKLSQNQLKIIEDITAVLLWILMLLASIIMLSSAIIPAFAERVHLIEPFISVSILQFSQLSSFLLGLLLLVLSDEIRLRVKRAYFLSMIFLSFGSIFTLVKGLNMEETLILIIITIIFGYTKNHFYRVSTPFNWFRVIKQMIIAQGIISLYILSGQTAGFSFYNLHKGIELLYMTPANYLKNGIILSISVQGFIILWNLFWNFMPTSLPPWLSQTKSYVFSRLNLFLKNYPGTVLTHLIYSGDKFIYVSETHDILMSFRPYGDKLVVLGDPIGNLKNMVKAFDEFRVYADLYGYSPVYYQVDGDYLPEYHEIGYTFFKLGEDAVIDLNSFTLENHNNKGFRNTLNHFEREGWMFTVSDPPHSETLMNRLESISKEWLKGRKEKGFSLGSFDRDFLNKNPVGFISSSKDEIVAFTSIMPIYKKELLSVDLIRFSPKAPNSTMDYLFIKLFLWGKERGYPSFYMGMAPLSNVGESKFAQIQEKAAKLIFWKTKARYNFKGLRQYKEKFHPQWRAKYLAYPGHMRVEPILISISLMIAANHKKILKP